MGWFKLNLLLIQWQSFPSAVARFRRIRQRRMAAFSFIYMTDAQRNQLLSAEVIGAMGMRNTTCMLMKKSITYTQTKGKAQRAYAARAEFGTYDEASDDAKKYMEIYIKQRCRTQSEPRFIATANTDIDTENMPRKDRTDMRHSCARYDCNRPARVRFDNDNNYLGRGLLLRGLLLDALHVPRSAPRRLLHRPTRQGCDQPLREVSAARRLGADPVGVRRRRAGSAQRGRRRAAR